MSVTGTFKAPAATLDFGFRKAIATEHRERLASFNLSSEVPTDHLAFQIVDHSLEVDPKSINIILNR